MKRICILASWLVFFSISGVVPAAEEDIFEVQAEGSYRTEVGSSIEKAKAMALFIAKRKAVESAGKYLSHQRLIETYELDKDEIYCLTARQIQAKIIDIKSETVGKTTIIRLRIRAQVKVSDFIKAEIEDAKQERKETKASWREEMEQQVSKEIDPGKDIAKAYRLMREKKWRISMIYLNHLEKKYPNWSSIYMAKAIVHYILHEPEFMENALKQACRLDNQTACDDLKNLKRVHEHDFGLSIMN